MMTQFSALFLQLFCKTWNCLQIKCLKEKKKKKNQFKAGKWPKILVQLEKVSPFFQAQWTKAWAQKCGSYQGTGRYSPGSGADRSNPQKYQVPIGLDQVT